jgi:hypothetical protein
VDAVCINQTNGTEKEQQILLMAKIYGQANRVIVWLGEAAHNSDQALEDIRVAWRRDVFKFFKRRSDQEGSSRTSSTSVVSAYLGKRTSTPQYP